MTMTRREEIARLVERLRNDGVVRSPGIFEDAASALTQQEAEIARLQRKLDDAVKVANNLALQLTPAGRAALSQKDEIDV